MLKKAGGKPKVLSSPEGLVDAERVVLPGVGSFDVAIRTLREQGWVDALEPAVLHRKLPYLGICLGMQMLLEASEEGSESGLGWLPGCVNKFQPDRDTKLKVPHMGWNLVEAQNHPLFGGLEEKPRFYFVHSYRVDANHSDALCFTNYGQRFVSGVARGNILGVQFHPEKSHRFGLQMMKNFLNF